MYLFKRGEEEKEERWGCVDKLPVIGSTKMFYPNLNASGYLRYFISLKGWFCTI
jgi:hypothetical protein